MNNRQNGRRRGRSNNGPRQSGGQSRNYDSGNRIDNRARGNATQLLEKYRNLARDAQLSGDRVMTEYYLQFADHYFRVLSDARLRQEEQRGRFEERDDRDERDESESSEDGEELDAIDMIGRAPRNRGNRYEREPRGSSSDNRRESRERPRADAEGENDHFAVEGRNPAEREPLSRRDRGRGGNHRSNGHDDESGLAIDIAVLPPAIGAVPSAEPANDEPDDPTPPKRRGRPRKAASEGEAAEA